MGTCGSDAELDLKVKVELDEEREKTITEENFEKRFVNIVNKIIRLKRIIKVFAKMKSETRRFIMVYEFKVTLPVFDGKDYNIGK